jgi:hypothetical protein
MEVQLTDLMSAGRADEEAFATAERDLVTADQTHEELAGAVAELRDLARDAQGGELSPPQILAQVRSLKDQIYRVAAQSLRRPPRTRVATSQGGLEYPPVQVDLATLGLGEESFDLSSSDSARATAAAAGQALQAIRSMRAHLAQFMVHDLPTAQDAARIAQLNAESADSALLWGGSDGAEQTAETAALLAEELPARGQCEHPRIAVERQRLEVLLRM